MKKPFGVLALALCVAAIVLMLVPTYTLVFGADGGGQVLRNYRWYDPLLLGSADVIPAASLACGVVMSVGLVAGLAFDRAPGWVALVGLVAASLLLFFGYDADSAGFVSGAGQLVAPILGAASVLAAVAWWLGRRPAE